MRYQDPHHRLPFYSKGHVHAHNEQRQGQGQEMQMRSIQGREMASLSLKSASRGVCVLDRGRNNALSAFAMGL